MLYGPTYMYASRHLVIWEQQISRHCADPSQLLEILCSEFLVDPIHSFARRKSPIAFHRVRMQVPDIHLHRFRIGLKFHFYERLP